MTPFEALAERLTLGRKRRLLAHKEEWARTLEDQIDSGRAALNAVNQEIQRLRAEVFAQEDPVDILRRAGV